MARLPMTWRVESPGTALPIQSDESDPGKALSRLWILFVVSWPVSVVLLGPVVSMVQAAGTPAERLGALGWTFAFLGAYLRLVLHQPFRLNVSPSELRIRIGLLALLTALVLFVDLVNDPGYFWLLICVFVPAGIVLPSRTAAWLTLGLTALAIGIELVRWGWPEALQVAGIAIWGVSTIMLRQMIRVVGELRAARKEWARLAVAEERLRFARDLHDLLGHSLSLIALKSELAGHLLRRPDARVAAEIEDIELVSRRALREVREAVAGYRRPALGDELENACKMLNAAGIDARIDATIGTLPAPVDAVLAWTVREGVTNVIRHSGASRCDIDVWGEHGAVGARLTDDGVGAPSTSRGNGLSGIAERAAVLSGQMDAGPGIAGGFSLTVTIPVDAVDEPAGTAPCERTVA